MIRNLTLILSVLCVVGCASHSNEQIAPNFYGHYQLLSQADQDVILDVARPRVAALMPGAQIENVKVFSATEADVTFGRDFAGSAGDLYLEKIKGKWKITIENKPGAA